MSYMLLWMNCGECGKLFASNPHKVPSIDRKIAFCKECIVKANDQRIGMGLEPIPIHPEAYEPVQD